MHGYVREAVNVHLFVCFCIRGGVDLIPVIKTQTTLEFPLTPHQSEGIPGVNGLLMFSKHSNTHRERTYIC